MENLFHLIAMLGQLLSLFIPIFGSHEVITINSMAFFILYEFFALSYTDMLNLKYSRLGHLCFWLIMTFSTISVALEYFVYVFEQPADQKDKDMNVNMKNRTSLLPSNNQYTDTAQYFNIATVACYSLLVLQFFMK
ncbi:hypothetical protein I4U23_023144 [Adineta vaga]|nr:hypothetical protein I4U23_023144 [Adineta vaga]